MYECMHMRPLDLDIPAQEPTSTSRVSIVSIALSGTFDTGDLNPVLLQLY